jgi:hypothetical protein
LFAFAPHDVVHDLVKERHIGLHELPKLPLEGVHFGGNRCLYVFYRKGHCGRRRTAQYDLKEQYRAQVYERNLSFWVFLSKNFEFSIEYITFGRSKEFDN